MRLLAFIFGLLLPTAVFSATPVVLSPNATASRQAKSKTNCSALAASYATLLTTTFDVCIMHVFNGCDGTWVLSIDSGTTDYLDLAAGESVAIDFCANGLHILRGVTLRAKDGTTPPTTGTLRISVEG